MSKHQGLKEQEKKKATATKSIDAMTTDPRTNDVDLLPTGMRCIPRQRTGKIRVNEVFAESARRQALRQEIFLEKRSKSLNRIA
jgi:hypothetical protein